MYLIHDIVKSLWPYFIMGKTKTDKMRLTAETKKQLALLYQDIQVHLNKYILKYF